MSSVDVVIPCYNYGRYLTACVQSALSQAGVDVRVTIVNDASSDTTAEVADQLARADARVRVIHHQANKGHIATYNEGLALATCDYVVLLSADDLLTPGALRRATDLMDAHPNVGLTYGFPIPLYQEVLPTPRTRVESWSVWKGADWIGQMCRSGRNFITCPEAVMRTSVQHAIGGYRPELPHSGDMEMWMRAAAVSDIGRINGADQAYYRIHSASMQRTIHSGFLLDLNGRYLAFESVLGANPPKLPNAEGLLDTARQALAKAAVDRVRSHGQAGALEPVDEYLKFALQMQPELRNDKVVRRLETRPRGRQVSSIRQALGWFNGRVQRVQDYLLWRRWWKTGVY